MQIINIVENQIKGDEHIIARAEEALENGFDIEKENAGIDGYRSDSDVLSKLFNKADSRKDDRSAVMYFLHREKTIKAMKLAKWGEVEDEEETEEETDEEVEDEEIE